MIADDFVNQAWLKALAGERRYDPAKTLFVNLWNIVSSDISAKVNHEENKRTVYCDESVIDIADLRPGCNQERSLMLQIETKHFISLLHKIDKLAAQIAQLILSCDFGTSLEVALELGIGVSQVENAKKRLRRHIESYVLKTVVIPHQDDGSSKDEDRKHD